MTGESPTDLVVPPLTLIEDPEAAEAAHQGVARRLRLCQELGRQTRFPLKDGRVVDAPEDREQEARAQARGVEAERGVEVDDARAAVFGDQDVVALAQVDVGDAARVDLPHQGPEPVEHGSGLRAFPAAPAGDPLPLDRLHQDATGTGLAEASRDAGDPLQPAEGPHLPGHLAAAEQAHRPGLVGKVLQDGAVTRVPHALDVGFGPAPLPDDLDRERGSGGLERLGHRRSRALSPPPTTTLIFPSPPPGDPAWRFAA